MSDVPAFVQISAVKTGDSGYCYALDHEGRVWCHGKWYDRSQNFKFMGEYWKPLSREGPPPPLPAAPPTFDEIAQREVEELLR